MVSSIVFVQLLDEGTVVYRPTEAVDLGSGRYRLLPTPDYDPDDETWEFLPNTVVVCSFRTFSNGEARLVAEARTDQDQGDRDT